MRKILLFMVVLCIFNTQIFASGSPSAKQSYLKENFTASTTSNYDPMDVFGILTFFMQYSEQTGKWNYELVGLTWDDMAEAISGNPDAIFNKLPNNFTWKESENLKVLTRLNLYGDSYFPKFRGIFDGKYFKNLKVLDITHNAITHLDLSKNTNLKRLDCYNNQLTILNTSNCTNLTQLNCGFNKLTNLDVSKNTNLNQFSCHSNKLTTLDLSKNTNLNQFSCYSNKLTTLDLSKNTNLTWLACSSNSLNHLDISKNTNLAWLDCVANSLNYLDISKNAILQSLACSGNQLTYLDTSKNINLYYLACSNNPLITSLDLSKNTNLNYLDCRDTPLTSLDVSKNTNLTRLYCNNTKLTSLDVSKNINLKELSCKNNQLKFSTLTGDFSKLDYRYSTLGPQALLQGGTKGFFELIDLSSEYNTNGTLTTFKWYDKATNREVSVFASNGTFYASPANAGKTLLCKMTNALYPDLTIEYEVTITNSMTQNFSAKNTNFNGIPEGFTLTGPEAESSNLKVYPNPVTDVVKITTPSKIESVAVYDYSGREVKRMSSVTNNEINLQGLATGNYILTIQTPQGTTTKKIIKK